MASDAFFAKANKRKRTSSSGGRNGFTRPRGSSDGKRGKPMLKKRRHNEDIDSQTSDSNLDTGGIIDELDLRGSDIDEKASGDEAENETAAQKRLRLAKLYLQSVKEDLGECLGV
jgi:ribosomal RNA-processing protein 9